MNYRIVTVGEDICHHGIKGQRWGVRRYQNKDGTLTPAGQKRYNVKESTVTENGKTRAMNDVEKAQTKAVTDYVREYNRITSQDPDKVFEIDFYDDVKKLLGNEQFAGMEIDSTGSERTAEVTHYVTGKKMAMQFLTKAEQKALNKTVRDQRIKKGETVAGLILGGSLAGLTWSYLKDLGMV